MVKKYQEKIFRQLRRSKKNLMFSLHKPYKSTQPVFIMGYGRSGTTMMLNIFERDNLIEALGENDPKVAKNFMLIYEK